MVQLAAQKSRRVDTVGTVVLSLDATALPTKMQVEQFTFSTLLGISPDRRLTDRDFGDGDLGPKSHQQLGRDESIRNETQ
jgi:hypothetical protein